MLPTPAVKKNPTALNFLILNGYSVLADYVNDFLDNYSFIELDEEEINKLDSLFPHKNLKQLI